jgi:hypothetical protein
VTAEQQGDAIVPRSPEPPWSSADYPSMAGALAALQTALPEIPKGRHAKVVTTKGTYEYDYAGLADISRLLLPLLGKMGLSFIARPTHVDGRYVLQCRLLHLSGEHIDGEYPLTAGASPQALGSQITYGRRYCLCAMTGVAPDDDDDAAAAEAEAQSYRGTAQRGAQAQKRETAAIRRQAPPTGGTGQQTAQRRGPAPAATNTEEPPLPNDPQAEPSTEEKAAKLLQRIPILWGEIGVSDRAERLRLSGAYVGRELTSGTDLTFDERVRLVDALVAARRADEPMAAFMNKIPAGGDDGA